MKQDRYPGETQYGTAGDKKIRRITPTSKVSPDGPARKLESLESARQKAYMAGALTV